MSRSDQTGTTGIEMSPARQDELPSVVRMVTEALAVNPIEVAVAGGIDLAPWTTLFAEKFLDGETFVARSGGSIAGCFRLAKWPNCDFPLGAQLRAFPWMVSTFGSRASHLLRYTLALQRWHPTAPHVHLDPIVVDPAYQRRGVGGAMMRYLCELADQRESLTYLDTDTEDAARFYRRYGFASISETTVLGIRNFIMVRSPRHRS